MVIVKTLLAVVGILGGIFGLLYWGFSRLLDVSGQIK